MDPTIELADLHRHLDGSLRASTVRELAAALRVSVPDDLRFHAGMGLEGALARFALTLQLLQQPDQVRRVAAEICEDAASERVRTLEIRFAPQLHRGAPIPEIVDAALDGIASARASSGDRPVGLLLCGLYGEPVSTLLELVDVASSRPGVVGIDLAGGPAPTHTIVLEDYAPAFARARELGISRTVHAAEGRSPAEIRVAIEVLHAQRIGHGTTLLDDPAVLELVLRRRVVIEACPTSNVHTGVIDSVERHPLPRWLGLGVLACVCTDNTFFSGVTATEEHTRVLAIPGMNPSLLARAVQNGHEGAFARG